MDYTIKICDFCKSGHTPAVDTLRIISAVNGTFTLDLCGRHAKRLHVPKRAPKRLVRSHADSARLRHRVHALKAKGHANKDIATALHITPALVGYHLSRKDEHV